MKVHKKLMASAVHREAPICAAGVKKLRDEGWRVVCEVGQDFRAIDAVGERAGEVVIMEAKTRLTKRLKQQLQHANLSADYAIAIIGGRARQSGVDWCRENKIGLWVVNDGMVTEILAPQKLTPLEWMRKKLVDAVKRYDQFITPGGLPNQKGVGMAQWVQAAVDAYKAAHPKATWKEIHANVPSHYRTHQNMYSALRSNAARLAFRKRMKAA